MKNLKSKMLKLSLAAFFIIAGCNNPATGNSFTLKNFPPITDSERKIIQDNKVVTANNRFGFKLFSELLKTDKDKNMFISPSSISFALTMTYNGADKDTKDAMAKTLEIKDMSLDEVNKGNNILIRSLINADPEVRLEIANSLWAQKGVEFNQNFINNNQNYFKASVTPIDFTLPESTVTVNKWVSDNTQNKIQKITDKLDPATVLMLINAIYFKGNWTNKFDKSLTQDKTFTKSDGSTKKVPMMSLNEEFKYYKGDKFQAIRLPYGKENIGMYVFLPDKDFTINEFLKSLNAENWNKWITSGSKTKGEIVLPRFKLEYESKLNDSLKALGMDVAFSESKANFKNMFSKDMQANISEVKHKTFVDVNEEGTEAAAVTSVAVVATAVMQPKEPFKMVCDHPFFYAIEESQTGTVLFMGTVNEPK